LLHRVNMGDVADILAARADSIFNVKVFWVYIFMYSTCFENDGELFDPEDGGSVYVRNVDNIAHVHNPRAEPTSVINNRESLISIKKPLVYPWPQMK
jgi:hypothetical protein